MNLVILTGAQLHHQTTLSTSIFRFRHQVFVDKLGWEALRHPSGLERDAFDTDSAVHFVVLTPHGNIAAYSRLLPTTQPHLLANVYPELLHGKTPPTGEHIWEWTRTTPLPLPITPTSQKHAVADLEFAICPVGRILLLGVVDWAVQMGIEKLSLQGNPMLEGVIQGLGGSVEVLSAESLTSEGVKVVPILIKVGAETVTKMRRCFGMRDAVVGVGHNVDKVDTQKHHK